MRLLIVLAGLSGAAPLATDMYVPALPHMAAELGTDASGAQLSLTGFLAGIIVGQVILGPVSDSIGRRPVLLTGTLGFSAFSMVCAVAPDMPVLDIARCGQGVSGAAGIVLARAVVADLFIDHELAAMYSRLGAITAAAPVLAPMAGGALILIAPWRAVFAVLAIIGVALAVGVWRWIPESLPRQARSSGGVPVALRTMGTLLARVDTRAPVLALSFGGAAIFTYIAGATFIFQDVYHLTSATASLVYGINALGNMAGSLCYGKMVAFRSPPALLVGSSMVALSGAAVLLISSVTMSMVPMSITWLCLLLSLTAFGVFFPAVVTIAQQRGNHAPGATSALLGGGQFLFGAAVSPIAGLFGTHSPVPTAAVMTAVLVPAVAAAVATARPRIARRAR